MSLYQGGVSNSNKEKHYDSTIASDKPRERIKDHHSSGSPELSLLSGKYTYYRKKKLVRRKVVSLSQAAESGSQDQLTQKSRKQDVVGEVSERTEVEMSILNQRKIGANTCLAEDNSLQTVAQTTSPGDSSSLRIKPSRRSTKCAYVVRSMSLALI